MGAGTVQGLPPGEGQPQQTPLGALATVLFWTVVGLLVTAFVGGWFAHVLVNLVVKGWGLA